MEHGFELLGSYVLSQHGHKMVGPAGASRERRQTLLVELVDGMAHCLFVAREGLRDGRRSLAACAGEQNLATTKHKGFRRTQPRFQGLAFLWGQVADKNAWFHRGEYTTFVITSLENAPGLNLIFGAISDLTR